MPLLQMRKLRHREVSSGGRDSNLAAGWELGPIFTSPSVTLGRGPKAPAGTWSCL